MDKVKQILELVRKHHFWILCALAALVGLIVWQMSTSSLDARFQTESHKITDELNKVQTASHDDSQAGKGWKDLKDKETAALKEEVDQLWHKLYDNQKQEVFKWPVGLSPDEVAKLEQPPPAEYPRDLLDRYEEVVKSAVAELPKIVDAQPLEDLPTVGAAGRGAAPPPAAGSHKVAWAPDSLDAIRQSFDWVLPATTLIVRQAQEELWVYESLCKVIKNVNESTTSEVPISQIVDMKIAYAAMEDPPGGTATGNEKRIDSILPAAASDSSQGAPAPGDAPVPKPDLKNRLKPSGGGTLLGGAPADAAAGGKPDDVWKRFRYVNSKNPIVSTGDPIKEPAELDEFAKTAKYFLIPFDLSVSVDDRYLDRLLIAMRNSVLPLEVQQVRINPQSGGTGTAYSIGGPVRSDHDMPRNYAPAGDRGSGAAGQVANTRYITVELRGVAYLLAPPNVQQGSGGETAPGESAPGADTAATQQAGGPAHD